MEGRGGGGEKWEVVGDGGGGGGGGVKWGVVGDGGGGGGGGVGGGLRITIHNNLQSCQLLPILHEIPFIYVLFLCEIKKVPFFLF